MAKEISIIRQEAQQVQNATQVGENTAQRVGGVLTDLVDKAEEHEMDIDNLNANTGVDEYPVFSTAEDYKSGDTVNYQGKLYQFTSDHAAGAWTGTDVEETDAVKAHIVQELGTSETAVMSQKAVTDELNNINANTGVDDYPVFSASEAYPKGKVVNYNGLLYRFTVDHAAGAWIGTDVEETSMAENSKTAKVKLEDLDTLFTGSQSAGTVATAMEIMTGLVPTVYDVINVIGVRNLICGKLFVYSDNSGHVITQVLFTSMTLDDNGALSGAHRDGITHMYYRTYGVMAPSLTNGKWTEWKQIVTELDGGTYIQTLEPDDTPITSFNNFNRCENHFYFASTPGTYTKAGNIVVEDGELALISWSWRTKAFSKKTIYKTNIVQETGDSETAVMSQKAVTDELNNINANTGVDEYPVFSTAEDYKSSDTVNYQGKLYQFTSDHAAGAWTGTDVEGTDVVKAHIVQELGDNEDKVVSQKGIANEVKKIKDDIEPINFSVERLLNNNRKSTSYIDSTYKLVLVDKEDHIIAAIDSLNILNSFIRVKFNKGIDAEELDNKVDKKEGYELIKEEKSSFFDVYNNQHYAEATLDKNGKVIEAITKDGVKVFGSNVIFKGDIGTSYKNIRKIRTYPIKDMHKWSKAHFGMFIHYSYCSMFEGYYTGDNGQGQSFDNYKLPNSMAPMTGCKITPEKYKSYSANFTADNWDAEEFAKLAYNAGCKYIVLTLQHAEGFLLCTSTSHEFDITHTSSRSTLVEELVDACKRYNIQFGFYFNQGWGQLCTGGFGLGGGRVYDSDPWTEEQHTEYFKKLPILIKELIDRYHPFEIWYDTYDTQAIPYLQYLKNVQDIDFPEIVTNDRLFPSTGEGDFATGEGHYYAGDDTLGYYEDCYMTQSSWNYTKDQIVKEANTLILRYLLDSFARGHNVLLNIGPKGDGSIDEETKNTWNNIASFVKKYGTFDDTEGVYSKCMPQWGRAIKKGNILKCYVMNGKETIYIDGILNNFVKNVYIYDEDGKKSNASWNIEGEDRIIINNIPYIQYWCTVIDVEFDNDIICNDYIYVENELNILAFNINGNGTLGGVSVEPKKPVLGGWKQGTIDTVFKFLGSSGLHKLSIEKSSGQGSLDIIIENNNEDRQSFVLSTEDEVNINLTNNQIYKFSATAKDNMAININSFKIN